MNSTKITFGIIVLNGEPFIKYNLRALYPYAHQIIIVEGASPFAKNIATRDGHSIDNTLEAIKSFIRDEDPDNRVQIVTAEDEGHPNGFWPGEKHEQSQAYAKRASGNWLWQIDVDEFYMPDDMTWICKNILVRPDVQAVTFRPITFWGGIDYFVDGWYLHYLQGKNMHRLFRWNSKFTYLTHRPPTVVDENGNDLRKHGWVTAAELKKKNIIMYHYSLLFPQQVNSKSAYYSNVDWGIFPGMQLWAEHNYVGLIDPFRVHNVYEYPSWLERYKNSQPPQVLTMWNDIQKGLFPDIQIRPVADIERLLESSWYKNGKIILKFIGPIIWAFQVLGGYLLHLLPKNFRFFLKTTFLKK